MNFQPPESNDHGHCLRCGAFVIEEEQKNGICIDCQSGGQAFPLAATEYHGPQAGMTLRDYFAAKALPVFARELSYEFIAEQAYAMADAMLAERAK